jgi:cytochrome b561
MIDPEGVDAVPDRGSPPRMPRWVKWSLIVIGVLLLLLLVVLPLFGVQHGPGRHALSDPVPATTAAR